MPVCATISQRSGSYSTSQYSPMASKRRNHLWSLFGEQWTIQKECQHWSHALTARESSQTDEIPHHLLPYKHMIIRAVTWTWHNADLVIARFFLRDHFLESNKLFRWRDHLHEWLERILARVSIITLLILWESNQKSKQHFWLEPLMKAEHNDWQQETRHGKVKIIRARRDQGAESNHKKKHGESFSKYLLY